MSLVHNLTEVEVMVSSTFQMPMFIVFKDGNKISEFVGADQNRLRVSPSLSRACLCVTDKP